MGDDCIFCKIAEGAIPVKKAYDGKDITAFYDIAPQAPVHILIIPKKHVASLSGVDADQANLLGQMLLSAEEIAGRLKLKERGYRVVINTGPDAGQAIEHLHMHLLAGRKLMWPPG